MQIAQLIKANERLLRENNLERSELAMDECTVSLEASHDLNYSCLKLGLIRVFSGRKSVAESDRY